MDLIVKYKYNWDNPTFVNSSHANVSTIQKSSRGNIISYKKEIEDILDSKKKVIIQKDIQEKLNELQKSFNYYRLSLYTYSLASMMEILLLGNFKEEYISGIVGDINKKSMEYRNLYGKCSLALENMGGKSIEANFFRGIGKASKTIGKVVGSIPLVKEGPVDEFLVENGSNITKNANGIENSAVYEFAELSNPGTGIFIEKMEDLIRIYNHTEQICFDNEKIYLLEG